VLARGKNFLLLIRHQPGYSYSQVVWDTTISNKTKDINIDCPFGFSTFYVMLSFINITMIDFYIYLVFRTIL
jgi:hypothetical protein